MSSLHPRSAPHSLPRPGHPSAPIRLTLADPAATERLAQWFARRLGPGDVVLLEGEIGAGKTHFARALIQSRLAAAGRAEEVPSPTFTLVQTYDAGDTEIWHADLYRLTGPDEVEELGLKAAFDTAICLVEWPDRLGDLAPASALTLRFRPGADPDVRRLELLFADLRWGPFIDALLSDLGPNV